MNNSKEVLVSNMPFTETGSLAAPMARWWRGPAGGNFRTGKIVQIKVQVFVSTSKCFLPHVLLCFCKGVRGGTGAAWTSSAGTKGGWNLAQQSANAGEVSETWSKPWCFGGKLRVMSCIPTVIPFLRKFIGMDWDHSFQFWSAPFSLS